MARPSSGGRAGRQRGGAGTVAASTRGRSDPAFPCHRRGTARHRGMAGPTHALRRHCRARSRKGRCCCTRPGGPPAARADRPPAAGRPGHQDPRRPGALDALDRPHALLSHQWWDAWRMRVRDDDGAEQVLARLASLRQHQQGGHRSPHKPLLVLLALGRLQATGSSELPWPVAEAELADLLAEFGHPSKTGRAQNAAYPFTRLRADGVWVLDADVQMDLVRPLAERHVVGRFEPSIESALRADPALARSAARALVTSNFPDTVVADVVDAVGLDPAMVLAAADVVPDPRRAANERRRDPGWRSAVLQAWDRQCAFCGYDGQLAGASVAVEAAHVRWFASKRRGRYDVFVRQGVVPVPEILAGNDVLKYKVARRFLLGADDAANTGYREDRRGDSRREEPS